MVFSNANISFSEQRLIWRFYIIGKILPITKQIKIIDKKEFAITVLDKNVEVFVMYITFFSLEKLTITIHLTRKVQIILLLTEKVMIFNKYSDFFNIFFIKKKL